MVQKRVEREVIHTLGNINGVDTFLLTNVCTPLIKPPKVLMGKKRNKMRVMTMQPNHNPIIRKMSVYHMLN